MTLKPSAVSLKPFAALALALGLPLALCLESSAWNRLPGSKDLTSSKDLTTPSTHTATGYALTVPSGVADTMKRRIRDLLSTPNARRRYLQPGVFPLFYAIGDMTSWYSLEMQSLSSRISAVDSHLKLVRSDLQDRQDADGYREAFQFSENALTQLNGGTDAASNAGLQAQIDVLAANAAKAQGELADLEQDAVAGDLETSEAQTVLDDAHKAIDDAESVLDTRSFMTPRLEDARADVESDLNNVPDGVLDEVDGTKDSYCHTFGPSQWNPGTEPEFHCQETNADVGRQTLYALYLATSRVERDPWLDVSPGNRRAVLDAGAAIGRFAGEILAICRLIPSDQQSKFQRVYRDLSAARIDAVHAVQSLVNLGPDFPPPSGFRKSQFLIEAARSMTQALDGLVAAQSDLAHLRVAAKPSNQIGLAK